jgi:hypothetical protein
VVCGCGVFAFCAIDRAPLASAIDMRYKYKTFFLSLLEIRGMRCPEQGHYRYARGRKTQNKRNSGTPVGRSIGR